MSNFQRIVLLFLIYLLPKPGHGQKLSFSFGSEIKLERQTYLNEILGAKSNYIYLLKSRYEGGQVLEKFDSNLNLIIRKDIIIPGTTIRELQFEKAYFMDSGIAIFSTAYDPVENTNKVFVSKVSLDGIAGKPVQIDVLTSSKKKNAGVFAIKTSDDSSKIVILRLDPFEKGEKEKLGYTILNKNLEIIQTRKVLLDYEDENFVVVDYCVGNDGSFHLMGRLKGEKNIYKLHIFSYAADGTLMFEHTIDLGDKYPNQGTLKTDSNNLPFCAGFYSNSEENGISGVFYSRIKNKISDEWLQSNKDFEADFLKEMIGPRRIKNGKGLPDYDFNQLVKKDNGGVLLVAEQFFIESIMSSPEMNQGIMHNDFYYHYHDIILLSIDSAGEIEWNRRIPKMQISRNDGGPSSSYGFAVFKDKVLLFYNDNPKNIGIIDPQDVKFITNFENAMPIVSVLNANGIYEKAALLSDNKRGILLQPRSMKQISDYEVVIYAKHKLGYELMRIKMSN